jgi:hypothetical protein
MLNPRGIEFGTKEGPESLLVTKRFNGRMREPHPVVPGVALPDAQAPQLHGR